MAALDKTGIGLVVTLAASCLAAWAGLACEQAPPPGPTSTRPAETPYDADYLAALAIADRFCEAWRAGDVGVGRMLLTRRLIRQHSDQRINDAIAARGNPRHEAFEIFDGQRLADGRFAFRVRLFLSYAGQSGQRIETPVELIIVAPGEDGQWRVDGFPLLQGSTDAEPGEYSARPADTGLADASRPGLTARRAGR